MAPSKLALNPKVSNSITCGYDTFTVVRVTDEEVSYDCTNEFGTDRNTLSRNGWAELIVIIESSLKGADVTEGDTTEYPAVIRRVTGVKGCRVDYVMSSPTGAYPTVARHMSKRQWVKLINRSK